MLRPHGTVIHIVPCNGWVNHGFYQISPTLMFDYYGAAGFDPIASALYSSYSSRPDTWFVQAVRPGDFGDGLAGVLQDGIHLYFFCARWGDAVVERPFPTQRLYSSTKTSGPTTPWFLPHNVKNGVKHEAKIETEFSVTEARQEAGHCWLIDLPSEFTSRVSQAVKPLVAFFENETMLGPSNTSHQQIREAGLGAYSLWNQSLYFSTSDNSTPHDNGRQYRLILFDAVT
jgi:hypothetical protein